jgi:16S rRNA (cytidine1402-2'-O)-methyltransferase
MGTLYLVATPIGNLEDISRRALDILQAARLIAAEDTRHTGKLLKHFDIDTPQVSYHEHNKVQKIDTVLETLSEGDVALVSDAGTPALNDPGYELVRAALEAGYQVSPVPGASAPLAALVASGLPTDAFLYLGYLPRKSSARRRFLDQVKDLPYTLVLLESPNRLLGALIDLEDVLGDRRLAVARELTKLHEEIFRGTTRQAADYYETHPPRGEITLVVAGRPAGEAEPWTEADVTAAVRQHLADGLPPSQVAKTVAKQAGWDRRRVYKMIAEEPDE